jgi:hypothetical protein
MKHFLSITLALSLSACGTSLSSHEKAAPAVSVVSYDFTDGSVKKLPQIFFSDYRTRDKIKASDDPTLAQKSREFVETHGRQPDTLEIGDLVVESTTLYLTAKLGSLVSTPQVKGLIYTHINRSDDVDTNLIVELGATQGIKPNTIYEVSADVTFYSNAPTGGVGVGGGQDAVRYGLSVSTFPWKTEVKTGEDEEKTYYRTQTNGQWSINPFTDPSYAEIGSINNGIDESEPNSKDFVQKTLGTRENVRVKTDAKGIIYANVRTHSGYEGFSIWALTAVKVKAREVQ